MKIYGHRGASAYAPENTMESFRMAFEEYGADGIELDVHFSKDGKLVVTHDNDLSRVAGCHEMVVNKTYDELQQLDVGSHFSAQFAGAKIPLLSEVMEYVAELQKEINIEFKGGSDMYPGIEEAVIRMIHDYSMEDKVILSSYDHYALARCAEIDPSIRTGILTFCRIYKPEEYLKRLQANAYHPVNENLTKNEVDWLHQAGYSVNVYTPNTIEELELMNAYGVDVVITNYPDRARSILKR